MFLRSASREVSRLLHRKYWDFHKQHLSSSVSWLQLLSFCLLFSDSFGKTRGQGLAPIDRGPSMMRDTSIPKPDLLPRRAEDLSQCSWCARSSLTSPHSIRHGVRTQELVRTMLSCWTWSPLGSRRLELEMRTVTVASGVESSLGQEKSLFIVQHRNLTSKARDAKLGKCRITMYFANPHHQNH